LQSLIFESLNPDEDPRRRTLAIIVRRPATWGNTGHVAPASLRDQRKNTIDAKEHTSVKWVGDCSSGIGREF